MLDQKDICDRLLMNPSAIQELRSQQRSCTRALGPFIFATLYNNSDPYDEFMDEQNEPAVPAVEEVTLDYGTPSRPSKR